MATDFHLLIPNENVAKVNEKTKQTAISVATKS